MISTVLLAEDMGLEPKKSLIYPCLLLLVLVLKVLKFQGFEAVSLAMAVIQQM